MVLGTHLEKNVNKVYSSNVFTGNNMFLSTLQSYIFIRRLNYRYTNTDMMKKKKQFRPRKEILTLHKPC